jgi:hypothetical protein
MASFLTIAVIAIVVVIAAILIYASTKPDNFHVERSISIKAAPENIFPFINDFHQWTAWTPYDKDPAMKKTYSGNASGKGAHYAWEGNKAVGKGEITITDTAPPNTLVLDLHMIKPFEARNVATFKINASGDATTVTWSIDDKHTLMLKTVSLFMDLDKTIGKDFEVGLARLKAIAEK